MEILRQPALLEAYLTKYHIREMFDTKDLNFRLFRYQKGEQIVFSEQHMEYLLFLVKGSSQIYGILDDARYTPLAAHTPFTIYGDIEFALQQTPQYYAEAQSEVHCLALSLRQYEDILRKDARFLNTLLRFIAGKLAFVSSIEASRTSLSEQLLTYMRDFCQNSMITSVNDTMTQLHCSRRQLQRVLKALCESGQIIKLKKGVYQLAYEEKNQ